MIEKTGKEIYSEGEIQVRTFDRDPSAHLVFIGEEPFLFQRGCLEQYAARTEIKDLREALNNYDSRISYHLAEYHISPEKFGFILARARIRELEDTAFKMFI